MIPLDIRLDIKSVNKIPNPPDKCVHIINLNDEQIDIFNSFLQKNLSKILKFPIPIRFDIDNDIYLLVTISAFGINYVTYLILHKT